MSETNTVKIAAKLESKIASVFNEIPRFSLNATTLLALAGEMGLIKGRRGRGGGYEPTDAGLAFINIDVEEFHTKEAVARQSEMEAIRRRRRETREHQLQAFRESITKVTQAMREQQSKGKQI